MIVGLLFIAIIWCLCGFLSYKQVVHNSCNMATSGLPDIYTQSTRAAGRGLRVYISGKSLVPMLKLYNNSCKFRIINYVSFVNFYSVLGNIAIYFKGPGAVCKLSLTIDRSTG